jgi:hypothetical protein
LLAAKRAFKKRAKGSTKLLKEQKQKSHHSERDIPPRLAVLPTLLPYVANKLAQSTSDLIT